MYQVLNYRNETITSILADAIQQQRNAAPRRSHAYAPELCDPGKDDEDMRNETTVPSSVDSSPMLEYEYEPDVEVLSRCLEIVTAATRTAPSSPYRSPCATLHTITTAAATTAHERKCSFDLDSSPGGTSDSNSYGAHELAARTAYSWSPPCTPSLDPPAAHYFTPKSTHSSP
jgi:hypothetical protein